MITDWDDAYANGAYIADAEVIVAGWAERAAETRARHASEAVSTGPGARQFFDLYRPEQAEQGLTIVIHGGYWMAFSGRDFAHLVEGPLARGQAVAALSYTLTPEARVSEITAEVARAVEAAATRVPGPIRLIGHSAGGHLAMRMVCDGCLPPEVSARIERAVSISGLHDLRPLRRTAMNETLRLSEAEAVAESPALLPPIEGARVHCVVGAEERPEFRRQTALLPNIWTGMGADAHAITLSGETHFSIIGGLEQPDGALTRLLLD
ncbi:alpha/beta hydrolase [Gymnodinialimonas ulvae]|uniref:alpha/beta hydrolase n=1 Tax=Gymnodinialimonas ulvae TaxID=3126504 RepID=UPI0030B542E7